MAYELLSQIGEGVLIRAGVRGGGGGKFFEKKLAGGGEELTQFCEIFETFK